MGMKRVRYARFGGDLIRVTVFTYSLFFNFDSTLQKIAVFVICDENDEHKDTIINIKDENAHTMNTSNPYQMWGICKNVWI
jgi:hypothetical protein